MPDNIEWGPICQGKTIGAQYTKLAPSTTFRSVSDYMALHYRYKLAREQVWPFIAVGEPR